MPAPHREARTGLVLSGGGARAAYQVGVLQGIAELLPPDFRQPFPIVTGTSAGAINAMGLAGRPGSFRQRTRIMANLWGSLNSASIYKTHPLSVARNALRIVLSLALSTRYKDRALALLDHQPLRELLIDIVDVTHIERAIAQGELDAIGITAMNYSDGLSTTFFQARPEVSPWQRARRLSIATTLDVEHLLASSALPTLFPATRIGEHFYGDGALRQTRPLSAAIRLGAERLLIIGVSDSEGLGNFSPETPVPPTIAQVLGQMLNAVFLDSIDADLESLERINRLVKGLSERQKREVGLAEMREIDYLAISPSESLADIARDYQHKLPRATRWFLKFTGSIKESGAGGALSYILFEKEYCQRLIELGYRDALADADRIRVFFGLSDLNSGRRQRPRLLGAGPVVRKPLGPINKLWLKLIGKRRRRI